MGELVDWVQPVELNGLRPGEPTNAIFQVLDDRRWLIAEERVAELISCIKPTETSEQRRLDVVDYVRKLIMQCVPVQVFTFGSVPLKTYLPDGDIDLTTFSWTLDSNDSWPNDVRIMLESEEKNKNAEFRVQEVQFIQAEVKIVKCLVENIVVDISFNQIGGFCTLCFLEEVDHIIGHNHLFKRSIILIKAWCYYESRILGAHHGLISTYALETLVLYIFHVFNDNFKGPLEVLYRFLEFFSKFDWENFCVSLWGPVPLGSLPEITAEPPRKDSRQLLLENAFLEKCTHFYGYNSQQQQNGSHFPKRSFNVVDPLRLNNNLGRSVSKGNFLRIRSALTFGAMKLARLLDCPEEALHVEVNQFFSNTWQRHGNRIRPDAPCKVPECLRPSTPDSSNCMVGERQESCTVETKNASTGHCDSVWKGHARKISSGTSSKITRNYSSPVSADVPREAASVLGPADNKNSNFGLPGCSSMNRNATVSEAQGHLNTSLSSDRQTSACSSSDYAADSEVSSSSYLDDVTFKHASKEHFAEHEQDRTKMMIPSMFHGFNGHFHFPLNMPSRHLPFAVPPSVLDSLSSNQKNTEGMFQGNIPSLENPWAMNLQFTTVPSSMVHYFHGAGISGMNGMMNPTNLTDFDVENEEWHNHDRNSYEVFDLENGTSNVPFDDREQSIASHQLQRKHESFRNTAFDNQYLSNVGNEAEEVVTSRTLPSAEVYSSTLRSETAHRNSIDRNEIQDMHTLMGQKHQPRCSDIPSKTGIETGVDRVSEERATDNPGALPFRFIPAGPPVPFLLTVSKVPNRTGTMSNTQIAEYEEQGSTEHRRWDIFECNLLSHLQILMYARSCQASQNNQRLGYPSQFTHPPPYCIPSAGSVRPLPPNIDRHTPFTGSKSRYIPVAPPVTSMPIVPPTDYQPCVVELPRYRGTGTYLPNPKLNVRDRKVSGNRNSYVRNDQQCYKVGSWIHDKPRVAGRNHIQNEYDKGGPRIHRTATGDSRIEKSWGGSYRRPDTEFAYQSQLDSLHPSTSSQGVPAGVEYDTYSLPACSAKGTSPSFGSVPSLMMMYPYGQKVGCSPQPQVLEFGSLGPVELPGTKEYFLVKDADRPTCVSEDLHLNFKDN